MSLTPFFSIIVPVYQSKDYLKETVNSLQSQTYSNIEILLIDDGSTDGSETICDELAKVDKRIKVEHQKNQGVVCARNVGLKLARGKWIIFVDSDDIVSKVMCKDFFDYIQRYNWIDYIAMNFSKTRDGLIEQPSVNKVIFELKTKTQSINLIRQMLTSKFTGFTKNFEELFGNNVVLNSVSGKAYKKSFIYKHNLLENNNVKYSEDLLFNVLLLGYYGRGIYVDDAIYYYRYNPKSVSHQKYMPNLIESFFEFKKILENLIQKQKIYEIENGLNVYILNSLLALISNDIFIPNQSIFECYKRFKILTSSKKFLTLCNGPILRAIKPQLKVITYIKLKLLVEQHFILLYLIINLSRSLVFIKKRKK